MQTQQDAELPNLSEHFIFAKTENGWAVKGPAGKSPGDRVKVLKKDGSDTVGKSRQAGKRNSHLHNPKGATAGPCGWFQTSATKGVLNETVHTRAIRRHANQGR